MNDNLWELHVTVLRTYDTLQSIAYTTKAYKTYTNMLKYKWHNAP